MVSRFTLCVIILLFQVFQIKAQIKNVALNKPTNQSSTGYGGVSSRAVDGNTNSDYDSGSCTHTQQRPPTWLCVDLQDDFNITNIKLYNRNSDKERLQGFEIRLGSGDQCNETGFISAESCYKDTASVQDVYTIDRCTQQPSTSLSARTVFIKATDVLTLCEVKIYTDCTDDDCQCDDNCQSCNETTGVCDSCKPGWFGTNCLQQCSTCKTCDKSLGTCNECIDGRYGTNNCQSTCIITNCMGNCDENTGKCTNCEQGYHGDNCQSSCNGGCLNNYCNKDTGDCSDGCKPGFSGSKCESCSSGRYGTNCQSTCIITNCIGNCDRNTGKCTSCKQGYHGDNCQSSCNGGCLNNYCNKDTGDCSDGCKPGFSGSKCESCSSGRYGTNCQSTCIITNCIGNCDRNTGKCTSCKQGYHGDNCQSSCNGGCLNNYCNKDTGDCSDGCKPGFSGSKCESCSSGRYGTNCQSTCIITNCIGNCDRNTGKCTSCKQGYHGDNCQSSCNGGCLNNYCNKDTGDCSDGCKPGFSGSKCESCSSGRYGTNCQSTCIITNCMDNCDRNTGKCTSCKQGYHGDNCQSSCNDGCLNNFCNKDTGDCRDGCKAGFRGSKCESCSLGRHGTNCQSTCILTNCMDNCDRNTGKCTSCKQGYHGDNCQSSCNDGCLNNFCNKDTGDCRDGCKAGFRGSKCESCSLGRHGTNCQSTCILTNCIGNCDRNTGKCTSCKQGYHGDNCQSSCNDGCLNNYCNKDTGDCRDGCIRGRYSPNCRSTCIVTNCVGVGNCDRITGHCSSCKQGYYGANCQQNCNDGCTNSNCNKDSGNCTDDCIGGRFSPNCGSQCTITNCVGNCDRITGQCSSCKPGWYGTNCETRCSSNCTDECNKSTGRCTECKAGIFGDDCNKPCPINCFGNCTRDEGKCDGCKPNTVGLYCNSTCGGECLPITDGARETCDRDGRCTECTVGRYTDGCDKNCSTACDGTCDRTNGTCSLCIKGYSGDTCDKDCNENCTICDQDDINNCSQCKDGRWGTSCNYQCSSNCKNGSCYQENGDCLAGCVEGKMGMNCSDNCTWGFYGENCISNCGNCAQNTTCEITRGSCGLVGCAEGYTGDTCHAIKPPSPDAVVIAVVVSVIVVGIVVLIIVSVVMLKRKRNKSNMPALESEDNRYENFTLEKSIIKHNTSDGTQETVYVNDARQAVYDNDVYVNDARPGLYENFQIARSKTCIDLKDLWETIQTKKQDKSFKPEYQKLPKDLCSPVDICLNDVNRPKNRYRNICAFDHTRVKLDIENDDPTSDYVNACYITGYGNIKNKYIAAQGPNDVNINDFVRMLWDVKTGKIAMVTNLHEAGAMKCLKYWPSSGKVKTFRKIKMELIAEDVLAHFTIRTLKMSKEGCGSRIIKHCHYTSWPDKGVPTDMASLVEFRNKVLKVKSSQPGPMVVHCSAGIGRTGTFLALDYLIDEGKAEGSVDVFQCVSRMRKERVNMVQTDDQYVFLHEAILEWYIAGDTSTTVTDYQGVYQDLLKVKQSSGKCQLAEKFEMMGQVCPKYTDADYSTALLKENKIKNRVPSILAYENTRILLTIPVPNTTDYINAVYIPSYKKKRAYILTQTPLANTVIDFWRMVVQKESQTIVHMDHGQNKTKGIGQYLPGDKPLTCEPFTITKTEEIEHEFYTIITCQVTGTSQDKEIDHTVRIYQCTFWKGEETTPKSSTPFFTLLEHIQSWTYDQKENPIIVHCRNGVNKGGLFCVLAAILERLTIEQDVSVLQTIIQLRVSRPQIITCYDQVKFCFDSVGNYLDNFSTYANSC